MSNLFLRLLNISITAGWIVLIVVLLRFVLKKAPKWTRVALWGLVAIRLLLPVSIESALSLVPSAETVKIESVTVPVLTSVNDSNGSSYFFEDVQGERVVIQSGVSAVNSAINPVIEPKSSGSVHTVTVLKTVAGWVWLSGAAAMLLYALVSYLRLRHRVRASVKLEKGVYVCDEIGDPFILGLIVPKVCLPSGMDETTRGYVLAHEKAHLKRFDHIWKPLGFLLLAVYWFNPLLWLAYILLCRDIELACDEKVVKEYDAEAKAAYSEALVKSSVSRRSIAACPLAFGETGVKSRVKSILNYKKPAFWIILVALLAGIVTAVCFLTMPKKNNIDITESDRTLILHAQTIEDSPNNYADPTSFHPVLTDKGMFHKAIIDGKHCLSFRTNDEREIHLLDGFAGNIQYHSPYVYATIDPDNWKELPKLYRIDLRNGSVEAFAEKVQIEYVYADGYVLWWSPSDETLYLSDWHGNNRQKVHENKGLSMIPTPNGLYMYGDGSVYLYERNRAFRKLYTSTTEGEYISECYYANENLYLLIQNTNGSGIVTVARLNTDGILTEICSIDNLNDLYSNSRTQLFLLPNDLLDALKEWSKRSIVFEKEIASGITLFGIKSDRIVRIYSYRNAIVYVNVDDYQEFVIPVSASDAENMQWLDYYSASNQMPWEETKEIAVDAFPNTRFRWTSGSVEAIENGSTHTLFSGEPIWNVYFTDLTGDGKPELCATVSFGSGIVDDHIVVYDYVNRQSYTLWDRGTFDYHLYTENGALLVGKTLCNSYSSDTSILDTGTLMMHDGVLCCRWSDGSVTPLNRELHESALYGEWIVEEEWDNDGNTLYTFDVASTWKEYNFREDGTVTYNETVPISSDSELAFGHPVDYRYAVYDNYVHIEDGRSCTGYYDAQTQKLKLNYQPSPGQYVYATLRRMGEDITDAPTAEVTPEPSPVPLFGSWTPGTGYHKIEPMGTVPEVFHTMIDQNLFRMGLGKTLQYTYGFADQVLTYSPNLQNDTVTYTISFDLYDLYGTLLLHAETALDPYFQLESAIATTDGGIVFAVSFTDRSLDDGTWASEHYDKATAYIIKIGADGKQQWKTALPTYTGWALGSCIEYDGAYFFFGNYETPEQKQLGIVSSSNISIIKIGYNGTILKQQELGGDDFDTVSLVDTDADGFILYADTQNSKGEFAASRYWKMLVDDDLNVIRMEPVDEYGHRFARYLGVVQERRVFTDDPRYFHYSDGSITCVLDYGAFTLVVSENDTDIYENQPKWINMTWNYTETVYAAYDLQGNLLWKTAVDSSPDYDALATAYYAEP